MPSMPVLPFWPADYLGDTRHLTAAEHGAYFLLMLAAWQSPNCSLPNEEKRLARMAACNLKQWRAVSDAVLGFWDFDEGLQKWTQKRLLKEHQKATLKSKQASLSAQARYLKSNDTGDANAERTHCERTATPSPSPSPSLNQKSKKEVAPLSPPKGEPPKKTTARKSVIPDDWTPKETTVARLTEEGFSSEEIRRELLNFVDWCLANAKPFSQPDRAFSKWVRKSREYRGGNGSAPASQRSQQHGSSDSLLGAALRFERESREREH